LTAHGGEPRGRPRAVVFDTSVLIAAAFRPGSGSARLVEAVRAGRFRLVWDEPTRRESETLFRRIPPLSWGDVADLFSDEDRYTGAVDASAFGGVPDPEDRKFAALAAAAGATLVSLDAHLLRAGPEDQPVAVRPGALLSGD
jgi:predicted nucleic acid-binding protein